MIHKIWQHFFRTYLLFVLFFTNKGVHISLIIPSSVCSLPVLHTPSYYKEESHFFAHIYYLFFFFTNKVCSNLFEYLSIILSVCNRFFVLHTPSYYRKKSYRSNSKCWQEVLNSESHEYNEILRTIKPTIWSSFFSFIEFVSFF